MRMKRYRNRQQSSDKAEITFGRYIDFFSTKGRALHLLFSTKQWIY